MGRSNFFSSDALEAREMTSVIGRFSAVLRALDARRHLSKPHRRRPRYTLARRQPIRTRARNMSRPLSLFSVQAILILAIDDGSRILTKYYQNPHPPQGVHADYPGQIAYKTVKDQKAFEKGLLGV